MKRSTHVPAVLLMSVAAAALSGCNRPRYDYSTEVRRCVDPQGRIRPDRECEPGGRGVGYVGYGYPRWVYGGNLGGDGAVRNFRSTPTPGNEVVSSSGRVISRGGFGNSAVGRSGGGFFGGFGG